MPAIVIGADTATGQAIVEALVQPGREVRAFVTDPSYVDRFKERGVKVALGDLSDASHVSAACTNCFSAILVMEAAEDGRDLAFADSREVVWAGWADAITGAGVRRAIWVGYEEPPSTGTPESVSVSASLSLGSIARRVAELDEAASLS